MDNISRIFSNNKYIKIYYTVKNSSYIIILDIENKVYSVKKTISYDEEDDEFICVGTYIDVFFAHVFGNKNYEKYKQFGGTSILLLVNKEKLQYVYIDDEIYTFYSKSKIVKYISDLKQAAVYAYDIDGNVYLFFDKIILNYSSYLPTMIKNCYNNPYILYYDIVTFKILDVKKAVAQLNFKSIYKC